MRKGLLMLIMVIAAGALSLSLPEVSRAEFVPFITGQSINFGWTVDVHGPNGTFTAGGETWAIEFRQETPGLNGFLRLLSFMGRQSSNFITLDVFVNHSGDSFIAYYYNYRANELVSDRFSGKYQIADLQPAPTYMKGYVPEGAVPGYSGQDFSISSNYAHISPAQGRIAHPRYPLTVYPVHNVVVSSSWAEFWMIGIDPATQHTYFLIFYTVPGTWVIDLWSGEVEVVDLGTATVTGDHKEIQRNIRLP